jgi:hypothetical protein
LSDLSCIKGDDGMISGINNPFFQNQSGSGLIGKPLPAQTVPYPLLENIPQFGLKQDTFTKSSNSAGQIFTPQNNPQENNEKSPSDSAQSDQAPTFKASDLAACLGGGCGCCNVGSGNLSESQLDAQAAKSYKEVAAHEAAHRQGVERFTGTPVFDFKTVTVPKFGANGQQVGTKSVKMTVGGHVSVNPPPLDPNNPRASAQIYKALVAGAVRPAGIAGGLSSADLSTAAKMSSLAAQAEQLAQQQDAQKTPGQ